MSDRGAAGARPGCAAAPAQVQVRVQVQVQGMGDRHAIRSVTARLRDVPGVETVVVDVLTGLVTVTGTASTADLVAAIGDSPCRAAVAGTAAGPPGA